MTEGGKGRPGGKGGHPSGPGRPGRPGRPARPRPRGGPRQPRPPQPPHGASKTRAAPKRPAPKRPAPKSPPVLRLGSPRRRLNVALIAMGSVLVLFAARLVQMQGLEYKDYSLKAQKGRIQIEPEMARRGAIVDVRGRELATSTDTKKIAVDASVIDPDQREEIAKGLSSTLDMPLDDLRKLVTKKDASGRLQRYVPIKSGVAPKVAGYIRAQKWYGVVEEDEFRRETTDDLLARDLLGFVGTDGEGLDGLERSWDRRLAGEPGEQVVERGANGIRIPGGTQRREPPVPGENLRLTLDRDVQWKAEQAISEQVKATGAKSGSVVVMDVRTGRLVAVANAVPRAGGDPAPPASGNPAIRNGFEPGSTNKVITVAGALEEGRVRPDTPFTVPDHVQCEDRRLRDSDPHKTMRLTVSGILAKSSNVGTVKVYRKLGDRSLYDYQRRFGFGKSAGVGFPGEAQGLLPGLDSWMGSTGCTVAYGQGVTASAVQIAGVFQTIANGGVRIPPRLALGTADERGTFTPAPAPKGTRVVSEQTARAVSSMLEAAVTEQGTGGKAGIPGYRVAGKTGTATRYDEELGRYSGYTATFAGFAPADDPRLVTLSVLQDPRRGYYGGDVAAPVFKEVMAFALRTRKIPPTGTATPRIKIHANKTR